MANEEFTDRLRDLWLPRRLFEGVLGTLPATLSRTTADLLFAAIQQWGPYGESVERNTISEALVDGWRRDGGVPSELERLRAMFRYRRARWSYLRFGDRTDMRQSEDELRSFWVTTGHDVADLDRYMAGVDAEFPDMSAG
jgi:hypothetical protein